ncbi:type II 3-dehydroquinate dehydratase [Falsigemmobacter faecalis]|uniref:type II 3-dehydroquinate dehydratase n=1 Tax=Falsigemmobacter faecalis TaxID=2488730 RepID=UPI001F45F2A5|nr:type II 3-dehydroquinate dehydratase [Falsigemmobacter faecalis]
MAAERSERLYILNGPNLNRPGKREPEICGHATLAEIETWCRDAAGETPVEFRQSNYEGQIVAWIHEAIDSGATAILINPAGLTFTSVPIMDALKMFPGPIIEVHFSNLHPRRAVYPKSLMSPVVTAVMAGLGPAVISMPCAR